MAMPNKGYNSRPRCVRCNTTMEPYGRGFGCPGCGAKRLSDGTFTYNM